jgi:hypothetical protein
VRVLDRSNNYLTVLQNYFPVNLHDWMPDNQIDMADCSNPAANQHASVLVMMPAKHTA